MKQNKLIITNENNQIKTYQSVGNDIQLSENIVMFGRKLENGVNNYYRAYYMMDNPLKDTGRNLAKAILKIKIIDYATALMYSVHTVKSKITSNQLPTISTTPIIDNLYPDNQFQSFDITKAIIDSNFCGIMIKATAETIEATGCAQLGGSKYIESPILEIYLYEKEKAYYQEYEMGDKNVTKIDLVNQDYTHVHSDAMISHNTLSIPLKHIYESRNKYGNQSKIGKGWRSNLHQYLIKNDYNEETKSREINYIDNEGITHTFEEKWYYEENGEKHYIDRDSIFIDNDQKFKCQLDGQIIEVNYEIKNKDKMTLILGSNLSMKNGIKQKKKKYYIQLNNKKLEIEEDADGYLLVPHFRFSSIANMSEKEKTLVKVNSFTDAFHFNLIGFIDDDGLADDETGIYGEKLYKKYVFESYENIVLNNDGKYTDKYSSNLIEKKFIKQKIYKKDEKYYTKYLPIYLVWANGFTNIEYLEDYKEVPLIVEESFEVVNNSENITLYENDEIKQVDQIIKNYEDNIESLKENLKNQYLSLKNIDSQQASSLLSKSEYYKSGQNHLNPSRYTYKEIYKMSDKISNETLELFYQVIQKGEEQLENSIFELERLQKQKKLLIKKQKGKVNDFIMDEEGNTLGFDGYGRLILIQDKEENKIQIEYGYEKENEGRILAVYSEIESIRFDYDKATGLLKSIIDPQGRKTKYSYDDNENLVSITYNDQKKTKFEYGDGFSVISPMLEKTKITETDNEVKVVGCCYAGEINQDTKLSDSGELKVAFEHRYIFNETNVLFKDELLNEEESYTFDEEGRITQQRNNKETSLLKYEGDNLIQEAHYLVNEDYTVLSSGTMMPITGYLGLYGGSKTKSLAFKIDLSDSLIQNLGEYEGTFKITSRETGKIIEYAFANEKSFVIPFWVDFNGSQYFQIEFSTFKTDGEINPTTLCDVAIVEPKDEIIYEYDTKDRLVLKKSQEESMEYFDYDEDDLCHHVKMIDQYNEEVNTYYSYNANKQLTLVEDSKGNVEEYTYDEKGNCIEKRSFNKKDASLVKIEKLNSETDEKDKVFTQYDKNTGELLSISSSSKGMNNATSFTYNYGLLTSMMHHGMKVNYAYDGQGRKTSISLNGSTYVTTTYSDNCDRKIVEKGIILEHATEVISTYKNKYKIESLYDKEGQLRKQNLNDETSIVYDYDKKNRLIQTIYSDDTPDESIIYEDDKIKKVTKGNFSQDYTYDQKDRIKVFSEKINNIEISNQQYFYIDSLRRLSIGANYGNSHFEYDVFNRVTHQEIEYKKVGLCHEYSYLQKDGGTQDFIAQDFVKVNTPSGLVTETYNYEYDDKGNIISIDTDDKLTRYQYDSLNRLVREDNPQLKKTIVYKYDTGGNILLRKTYNYNINDVINLTNPKNVDEYAYSCNGWKDQLISFNGKTFAYDTMGRPTTYKDINMTWNKNGTLASVGNNITYTYNANGIRTKKVVDGVETTFLLDGTRIVKSTTNNVELIYRYVLNKLVGFCYNNIEFIYERNILGDIIRIYNSETGEIVGEYAYDGYGNHIIIKDVDGMATLNPFRYRGYYFDSESNLFYLNSRYYDPEVGRFISPDIISILDETRGQINGLNLYMYCADNPIMNIDSTGYLAFWVLTMLIGAVAYGAYRGVKAYNSGKKDWDIVKEVTIGAIVGGLVGALVGAFASVALTAKASSSCVAVWKGFKTLGYVYSVGGSAAALNYIGTNIYIFTHFGKLPPSYYPPNDGFLNQSTTIELEPGTILVRFGGEGGNYVAPVGSIPFELSLPYDKLILEPSFYVVTQTLEVKTGVVAPWFYQVGGGIQYLLPDAIEKLREFLERL